jgi:enoyl-CoA hydratase/carnithine racemase
MNRVELEVEGSVAVLTMNENDNKLNIDMAEALLGALERVERETDALTLVVKSGHAHIWSNGFDLDWLNARLEQGDRESVSRFLLRDLELRQRLLAFPLVTVAAFNGHVFGGAAVWSCCYDFRFMRSDRGYFCIPVIDRHYPILPSTRALLHSVLPAHVIPGLILSGRRYTGIECSLNNIVADTFPIDDFMQKVMNFAGGLKKGREIVGRMKDILNGQLIRMMEADKALLTDGEIKV